MKPTQRLASALAVGLSLVANSAVAATITLGASADSFTRASFNAGTLPNVSVLGFTAGGDFVSYFRFDASAVTGPVTSATLVLHETAGSRNDGITAPRHRVQGLNNVAGNTDQNWVDSVDLSTAAMTLGLEYVGTPGGNVIDPARVTNLDADAGAMVTETIPGTDNVDVSIAGPDLVSFVNSRLADGGQTTFIVSIAANNRGYGFASRENADPNFHPRLILEVAEVPEPAAGVAALALFALVAARRQR